MALRFIRHAQQLKVLDAADETVVIARSAVFRRHAPAFARVGFDLAGFADTLAAVAARARAAYTDRSTANDGYDNESADVREVLAAFEDWIGTLHLAARAVSVTDHPLSGELERLFKVGRFAASSVEEARGEGPALLQAVESLGDLSDIGLDPDFVADGKRLLHQLVSERDEQWDSRLVPLDKTRDLHAALDEIVDLMERFARFREFAMKRSKVEIPDLSLAAIRSSLAGRGAPDDAPEAPADVAPAADAVAPADTPASPFEL